MADNETTADIIAAMRDEGRTGESSCLEWVGAKMRDYADRFEAAHRREKSEWVNANAGLAKLVDIEKVGDCARLREAHWVGIKYDSACCSKCGAHISTGFDTTSQAKDGWGNLYPYCPYCGAKMDLTIPFEGNSRNKKTK